MKEKNQWDLNKLYQNAFEFSDYLVCEVRGNLWNACKIKEERSWKLVLRHPNILKSEKKEK